MRRTLACAVALVGVTLPAADQAMAQPAIERPALARADSALLESHRGRKGTPVLDQPNIIVVYTDDQRWDTLDHMPAVSRMAEEGVLFTNSFVTTPVCGPSRASLLTGRLSSTQGIDVNEGASSQFDPSDTIAVKLQEQGYTTALFGKYINGYRDQFPAVPPGWSDTYRAFRSELFKYVEWESGHRELYLLPSDPLEERSFSPRRSRGVKKVPRALAGKN